MINTEVLKHCFGKREIADLLIGDTKIGNELLSMPYMSYNDIILIDKKILCASRQPNSTPNSRWQEMLYIFQKAISLNKLEEVLTHFLEKKHFHPQYNETVEKAKERYCLLLSLCIERLNAYLFFHDLELDLVNGKVKIKALGEERSNNDSKTEFCTKSSLFIDYKILANLLIYSKSKEEALSWVEIIISINNFPENIIKDIQAKYRNNDLLTFDVVTEQLDKLFARISSLS